MIKKDHKAPVGSSRNPSSMGHHCGDISGLALKLTGDKVAEFLDKLIDAHRKALKIAD